VLEVTVKEWHDGDYSTWKPPAPRMVVVNEDDRELPWRFVLVVYALAIVGLVTAMYTFPWVFEAK